MSHESSIATNFGLADALSSSADERALVQRLDDGLRRIEKQLEANLHFGDAHTDTIARYLFEAGGKRVRPLLALLTAEYGDSSRPEIIVGAQVLELIHLATLYHDDVMDNADLRRGVPTSHVVWGNSVAIITGDLLLARASSLASTLGDEMVTLHARTFERLCLGQLHETTGPSEGVDAVDHYLQVLSDKTGSLIASSAVVGLMTSGAPAEFSRPLQTYGEKVGVAFQIIDDILDLNGGETGKQKGNDVRNGVATLPVLLLRRATDAESISLRERIDEAILEGDEAEFASLIDELRESAHARETTMTARQWASEAIEALDILPEGIPKRALVRFAHRVIERTA